LETQLLVESIGRKNNIEIYSQVLSIEEELSSATTKKEILNYLIQRQQAMITIVNKYSNGEENETISL